MSGGDRNLVLPTSVFHRAVDQMKRTADFTFAVVLKQEQANSGTIVSFSNGNNRYLELQSSGRRDEIRFHYTHITAAGEPLMRYESFPYRLADDAEHKVALTVSGTEVQLYIDCHPLYKRVMHFLPDRNFSASNMQLFVGQRNSNSHYLFKGDLKDLRIITGPYGYLSQCELMDAQCPTCGQFLEYEKTLAKFQQSLLSLQVQLVAAENRITHLEKCDCKKSCLIDGTSKDDGDIWDIGCSQCKCESGVVTCGPRPCPEVKCKHPVLEKGACCPKCLKNCYINKKDYEHGDKQILGCRNCSCIDGNMLCDMLQCPELKCPPEQQLSVTDECCKFCQGIVGHQPSQQQPQPQLPHQPHQLRHHYLGTPSSSTSVLRVVVDPLREDPDDAGGGGDVEDERLLQEQLQLQPDREREVEDGEDEEQQTGPSSGIVGNSNSHENRELEQELEFEQFVEVEQDELREATFDTKFVEDNR